MIARLIEVPAQAEASVGTTSDALVRALIAN